MVIGGVQSPGIQMENPGVTCKGLKWVVLSRQHGGQLAPAEREGQRQGAERCPRILQPLSKCSLPGHWECHQPSGVPGKGQPPFLAAAQDCSSSFTTGEGHWVGTLSLWSDVFLADACDAFCLK